MNVTAIGTVRNGEVRRYRPRPDARVYALHWNGDFDSIPAEWKATGDFAIDPYGVLVVQTPKGPARVMIGAPIAQSIDGKFYPPEPAVFQAHWEVDE